MLVVYLYTRDFSHHPHCVSCYSQHNSSQSHLLFTGLNDVSSRLEQVEQGPSLVVLILGDTSDTSGDETDVSEPRRIVRSKRTYKLKKVWGQALFVRFLWPGPQMLQRSPAVFIVASAARTSLFLLTVIMSFCGSFEAAQIFSEINIWGWRRHAGRCWTKRRMPWVLQK